MRARQAKMADSGGESHRRTPCERLLSTPARRAYCAVNSGVSWRCRAVWRASWWGCSRTVSWRGAPRAEGQAKRVGHARQVAPSNRMRMTGSPETSCPGRQWTLSLALGTVRLGRASQAIAKAWLVIPLARPLLPALGPKGWPDDIDLVQSLGGDQEVGIDIAAVAVCSWPVFICIPNIPYEERPR